MLCLHPVKQDQIVNGSTFTFDRRCGYCETCRLHYRAVWTARIQLEAMEHASSCFVTLTYDEEHHPSSGSLDKSELQGFVKRLRRALEYRGHPPIRYFACGEYGDRTFRPHYHLVIFGLAPSTWSEEIIHAAWNRGFVKCDLLNRARSAYVAKYVTKKVRGAQIRDNCVAEFALMSRRPGVGLRSVERIVSEVVKAYPKITPENWQSDKDGNPILNMWQGYANIHGSFFPVGRYLRKKVGELVARSGGGENDPLRAALSRLVAEWLSSDRAEDLEKKRLRAAHERKAIRMLQSAGEL